MLSTVEDQFLLRQFPKAIDLCYEALSLISSSQTCGNINGSREIIYGSEHSEPDENSFDFDKFNSLFHQCKVTGEKCECVPFMAILIQSFFQTKKSPHKILELIWTFYGNIHSVPHEILNLAANQLVVGGYYKEAERVLLHSLKVFSQLEEWPLRDSFCKLHSEFVLPALQREEQTIQKPVLPSQSSQPPLPEIEIVQSSSTLTQSQTSSLSSSTTSASLGTFRSRIMIVGNVLKTFFQKQGVWMFLSSVITCVMIASALWRRSETRSLPFQRRRRSTSLTEQFWRSFRSLFSMAGRRSELL